MIQPKHFCPHCNASTGSIKSAYSDIRTCVKCLKAKPSKESTLPTSTCLTCGVNYCSWAWHRDECHECYRKASLGQEA